MSTYFAGYAWSILFPLQLLMLFARLLSCKIYFRLFPLLYLGVFVYPGAIIYSAREGGAGGAEGGGGL